MTATLTNPPFPPVVWLSGADMTDELWTVAEHEMWGRGFRTISFQRGQSGLDAWYLARAGVPVVYADFSDKLDDEPAAPGGGWFHGYNRYMIIGLVRARHNPDTHDQELLLINGGKTYEPWTTKTSGFDVTRFGELVTDAFRQGKAKGFAPKVIYRS